jgi:hypothetical protein
LARVCRLQCPEQRQSCKACMQQHQRCCSHKGWQPGVIGAPRGSWGGRCLLHYTARDGPCVAL